MPKTSKKVVVDQTTTGRVDKVVQDLTQLSRAKVRGLIDHACVRINGQLCDADFTRVKPGDVITVHYDPHNLPKEKPRPWKDTAFRLVFEDDHLLVVDKAAWALTVPEDDEEDQARAKTVVEAIRRYLERSGRDKRPVVVHRLDRGTSGLLVFAKTQEVADRLWNQFVQHKPRREYLALVSGLVQKNEGTFRSYLATAADLSRYSTKREDQGELAITHFKVQQRLQGISLLRLRLETGRRNQIRVHLAEIGHPVLGDPRYRKDLSKLPCWPFKRLALHAAVLGFVHPVSGMPMQFESPLPGEFVKAMDSPSVLAKPARRQAGA